ncbi:MAG: hypothetical protein HPAVJP_3900 [Candidatus Hepatoplasma vulgare]|nr:MAG: hypothetical protein HPAVJP_3900 [Candidatus Hepatoplasma sp.]
MFGWFYIVAAIIFLALSGWFMIMYYSNSTRRWRAKDKFYKEKMIEGSYVGFWQKHKWTIVIYLAYVFLIIFIALLILGINLLI